MRNKYGAKKITIDGITFHSKKEGARYCELKMLQKAGIISDLELQPKFLIIPAVVFIGKKMRERYYIADFKYKQDSETIIEDVKGKRTELYKLKRNLFLHLYSNQYKFIET